LGPDENLIVGIIEIRRSTLRSYQRAVRMAFWHCCQTLCRCSFKKTGERFRG
jgi:hypothetical protein